jgi:hypothetical protein
MSNSVSHAVTSCVTQRVTRDGSGRDGSGRTLLGENHYNGVSSASCGWLS